MVKKVIGGVDNQWNQSVGESAHLIWLAGLGAFAKLGVESGKLFDSLVKEGEKVEKQSRQAADAQLEAVREKTDATRTRMADTWDKVEQLFEDRLARVLGRLGVPGRDDLRELVQRVEALQRQIDDLGKARQNQP